MKKLKKFLINPEKVIKNDELVDLKGGYSDYPCTCVCFDANLWVEEHILDCWGYVFSESDCPSDCQAVFGILATGDCGINGQC